MEKNNSSLDYLRKNWKNIVKDYQVPDTKLAIYQMVTTFLPFLALWGLMYYSLRISYLLTLALALVNAFFLVRIFIIQHDCGHQSFLKYKKVNNLIGFICSGFSLIPYKYWAKAHNFHHGHCGRLEEDIRDIGDMPLMTVTEYKNKPTIKKIGYRLFRTPIVLLLFGSVFYVLIHNRYVSIKQKGFDFAKKSIIINNLYIISIFVLGMFLFGIKDFLMLHLPIVLFFSVMAFFAFYIQHQHEQAYKKWRDEWDYVLAALKGSTYWKLPKVFQWLTGNIGIHHIHHLSSLIPNYNLEKCKDQNPILQEHVTVVGFFDSVRLFRYKLWDEYQDKMITFKEYDLLYANKNLSSL